MLGRNSRQKMELLNVEVVHKCSNALILHGHHMSTVCSSFSFYMYSHVGRLVSFYKPLTVLQMIKLFKCQPGGVATQLQVLAHLPLGQTLLR